MKRYRVVYFINQKWETESAYIEAKDIAEAAKQAMQSYADKEIVRIELTGYV